MLKPKLITTLKGYTADQFFSDVMAGIVVGIVAIPLAIAFAIASGVSPERGLYTAVIGGFVASLLGGSRVQISGPTGAFIVIVYSIVTKYGLDGLLLSTVMAGFMLIVIGLAGFGSAIKFIPYPLIVGFTSGIAVIIFSSQIKDLLGLSMGTIPAEFHEKWLAYSKAFHTIDYPTTFLSLGCIALISLWKKIPTRIPGFLVAIIAATVLVKVFHVPVETIGSRFGEIPHGFPQAVIPQVSLQKLQELSSPAMTIALLAAIESLLSAVVADGMIGGKHRSNMELIAQGFANIFSPLFGGIPVTGAIARTAANIQNGGRTPIAGIVHALFVLVAMVFLGSWLEHIPLAALAAILTVVAYNMSEWHSFMMLLRSPRSDVAVLLVTFFLTVAVDLTVAIQVGMILSMLLFMRRMSMVANVEVVTREFNDEDEIDDPMAVSKKRVPEGVEIFEVNGPFFFGAAYKFIEAAANRTLPKIRIIRMRNVPAIDATGIHALEDQLRNSRKKGVVLLLSGVQPGPLAVLEKMGFLDKIGRDKVLSNIDEALKRVEILIREGK